MRQHPYRRSGFKARESEYGQVVVEVLEEVAVVSAKLEGIVILQRRGQLLEHVQELAGGLIGKFRRIVEDQEDFTHEGISGWG
jgi:hypothetical protein